MQGAAAGGGQRCLGWPAAWSSSSVWWPVVPAGHACTAASMEQHPCGSPSTRHAAATEGMMARRHRVIDGVAKRRVAAARDGFAETSAAAVAASCEAAWLAVQRPCVAEAVSELRGRR